MKLSILFVIVCTSVALAVAVDNNEESSREVRREALRAGGRRGLQGGDGGDSGSGSDDSGGICFSAHNTIELSSGRIVAMSDVQTGDMVRVDNSHQLFSQVIGFSKLDHGVTAEYLQLHARNLAKPLELSPDHMVFTRASSSAVAAKTVQVGDVLQGASDFTVTAIKQVTRRGAYAPITTTGNLVVNGGVTASCYVAILDYSWFNQHAVFHAFMAPFRLGFFSNWSYGKDRSHFFEKGAFFFARLKHEHGAAAQYLISLTAVPIWMVGSILEFVVNHFWLLGYALAAAGLVYYKSTKLTSKVKTV